MQTGQQARQPRPNRAFWPGAGRGDILSQISKALMRAGAVVVLTGGAAMGKTRLAFEAVARVEAAAIPCNAVAGDRRAELTAIIDEMALLAQNNLPSSKARGVLVVDQAESAGADILEQLILIAEQASIAVMLIGRAELVGMLVRSVPEQVCDAITRYVALEPLNAIQTAEFVMHCLAGDASREETSPVICGDDAFRRILAHSHGVPGEIDRLMTDALRLAKLSRSARLTATVIDMIADDEDQPGEQQHSRQEPLAELPDRTVLRQAKAVAVAPLVSQPPPILTRSMQTILTDLQERSDAAPGDDGRDNGGRNVARYGGQDDPTIPEWPNSAPRPGLPPVRPARRVPSWAGGVAFAVAATSLIALQHYLQSSAPVLAFTDRSRAVVSSVVGDTMMRPTVTSQEPAPAPVEPVSPAAEPPPTLADKPMVQVAVVDSPMLNPPEIDGEANPNNVQATDPEAAPEAVPELPAFEALPEPPAFEALPEPPAFEALPEPPAIDALPELPALSEEPITEPTAETAPDVELPPMEPAATAQPESEPPASATDAMAPAEPETASEPPPSPEPTAQVPPEPEPPSPSVEALSPPEPEAAPVEPLPLPLPEPTVESTPEPEPAAPSVEALSPPEPEAAPVEPLPLPEPTAESTPEPEPPAPPAEALSPVESEAVPAEEPPLPEPTTAEGQPEQTPADTATEMTPPDAAEPPIPETPPPEGPAAEMSPPQEPAPLEPPAAVAVPETAPQEPAPEQASPSEPEPEPTVAEPSPSPEPVAEPPAPEPATVTAAPPPPPAPAAPKPPSVAESALLARGDRLLAIGDVASARLLYETAAAGGSARGALLAGRTLDPAYLRSLGARGVTGDPARAATWYEKAAELGDDSATALLEALERR